MQLQRLLLQSTEPAAAWTTFFLETDTLWLRFGFPIRYTAARKKNKD